MLDASRTLSPAPDAFRDLRAREQEALLKWLDADHGTAVLIHGPRGVGKARLAEHLKQGAAQRPDVAVLEARCPAAGARSFHPFADMARQAMVWAEQRGLTERLVDPVYADLSPVIDHAVSEDPDFDAPPSLVQKLGFYEGFQKLLSGIGSVGRICAIVHDLERADSDTLELAEYLADELFGDRTLDPMSACRGVLALLVRESDDAESRIKDFILEMEHRRAAQTLRLRGLDLDGLRQYVQSPHLLQKLLTASSGLPQEVDALIEALPGNVEELFERRLETLGAFSKDILVTLAVSGRPASARQLAEVSGHSIKEVAKELNALRSERILTRRIQSGEFHFAFNRRRDLEVAQLTIGEAELARLHGSWAEALVQESDSGGPALLAYHLLRSTEPQQGIPLAVQAAERHAVAGAFNAAIQILEDALSHAEGEVRLAILGRLAELGPLTGNPRRALQLLEAWKAALEPHQRGPALRREAELNNAAGDFRLALRSVVEARGLLESSGLHSERAQLEATASEAHYQLSELDAASQCCEAGLRILTEADEPSGAGRVRIELLNQLGKIALAGGDVEGALSVFGQTLDAAAQHGLRSEEARALLNVGIVRLRQGDLPKARRDLDRGIDKAREANEISRLAFGYMNVGVLRQQVGELGPALEAYRECQSLFRRLGNRPQLARVYNNLANLYLRCGDLDRARAHNEEALRLAQLCGVERVVAMATVVDGTILAEENRIEDAEARLREGMVLHRRLGGERPLEVLMELCALHLRIGAVDRARSLLEEARTAALDVVNNPVLSTRLQCLEALLDPNADDAVDQLQKTRDQFYRLGRIIHEHDAELGLAQALQARGRSEMARVRLAAASRLQEKVARELPDGLRATFQVARPQRRVSELSAELEGQTSPKPHLFPVPSQMGAEGGTGTEEPDWNHRYAAIVGGSQKLAKVFRILDRISQSDGTVLIAGESGTGKELVAEAIHQNSTRSHGPFVKINCAALVESLLLSELFGHERGSFTGAYQRKTGRFEMAAGGTLFLDEIGDISPKTQVCLLRVLQERAFERVGGEQTVPLNARLIFATNRNLLQMVRDGDFREDLYYRLKGLTVELPPLRERPEDIVPLANHFLERHAHESNRPPKTLSSEAVALLLRYTWPGNIRELENILRTVALFADGPELTTQSFDDYRELFVDASSAQVRRTETHTPPFASTRLPETPSAHQTQLEGSASVAHRSQGGSVATDRRAELASGSTGDLLGRIFDEGVPLPDLKKQIQSEAIARALQMTDGNITRAAEVLGMRRPRLSQIINADDELKELAQGSTR